MASAPAGASDQIFDYLRHIRPARVESSRRHLFKSLLLDLFGADPGARKVITEMNLGVEAALHIPLKERIKVGFADTLYGRVLIEFKADMKSGRQSAEDQLRDYVSSRWTPGDEAYTLIATDGIEWRIYGVDIEAVGACMVGGGCSPSEIQIKQTNSFTLTESGVDEFYFFLDRYLFQTETREPTLANIKRDFGEGSEVFQTCFSRLAAHFADVRGESHVQTAHEQWQRFLAIAYGRFEAREDVFLVHTYLSLFSKILAYVVLTGDDHIDEGEQRRIVDGSEFERQNVRNFAVDDFYNWIAGFGHWKALQPIIREITVAIGRYDFSRVDEDILKGVYQELIDLDTRHALGEYYTPDWLCERVVAECDVTAQTRILDPACGSGSFLRAALARMMSEDSGLDAEHLASHVVGIDIHPLSVQIAKTTVLLTLGEKVRECRRPVTLSVYLANTLRLPEGDVGLFGDRFALSIDKERYSLPTSVFTDPGLFDLAVDVAEELAEDVFQNAKDASRETLTAALKHRKATGLTPELTDAFYDVYRGLTAAKRNGRDSIWRFVLQNTYKPFFLREQFDLVVGNPPWLTYADIASEDYQDELWTLAESTGVAPRSRANAPHLEIAAIFMAHAASYFLKPRGQLAFVLPRSFFSADHHANTRSGKARYLKITHLWDLDGVSNLFRVPSCVIFAQRAHAGTAFPKSGRPGYAVNGRLREHNATWAEAAPALTFQKATWYLGYLGSHTAFTRRRALTKRSASGAPYKALFKQGATLVPRNFYFVEPVGDAPPDWDDRVIHVQTAEAQRAYAKPPWKSLTMEGRIHTQWLFRTALAKSLLPFALVAPDLVLLPAMPDRASGATDTGEATGARGFRLLSHDHIRDIGDLESARWFRQADLHWRMHRTEKNNHHSFTEYLDWQGKLTDQRLDFPFLVLYTAAAKDANATVVRREDLDLPFVVDHVAYWFGTHDEDEAYYLAAFINSEAPNRVIKDFQTRGLFGPRHVHKRILEVPLPRYDDRDARHTALAEIGHEASGAAAAWVRDLDPTTLYGQKLGQARLDLRTHLGTITARGDAILDAILTEG